MPESTSSPSFEPIFASDTLGGVETYGGRGERIIFVDLQIFSGNQYSECMRMYVAATEFAATLRDLNYVNRENDAVM